MIISDIENNTVTNTVSIWNYHMTEDGKGIISSEKIMEMPVPAWADRFDVESALLSLALRTKRWAFRQ